MANSISEPMMPAMMDQIKPVPVAPMPNMERRNPPITAPTMPIMIVTIMPPGSSPGMISLAKAPAISPTIIHQINAPITSLHAPLGFRLLTPLLYNMRYYQEGGGAYAWR